jgi:hypothetical protein
VPLNICNGNGTNLIAVKNKFNSLYELLQNNLFNNNIPDFLTAEKCMWDLITPNASNFGGL